MTTITLDSSKTPVAFTTLYRPPKQSDFKNLIWNVQDSANLDKLPLVRGKLPGSVYHINYLDYLEFCWAYHYIPVLTPDILWFGLLNEVASVIRDNTEVVRPLFSTKPDKQEITVLTSDPEVIPLDSIVEQLKRLIPSGTDTYLPEFSTTTPPARFAHYAAFCDAVSPYYNYSMFMCGLPAIRVEGTVEDYVKLAEAWRGLPDLLKGCDPSFFASVQHNLEVLALHVEGARSNRSLAQELAREFFGNMFACEKCGSGSQTEVSGWITSFQRIQPKRPQYSSNFAPQIAKVEYKALDSGREFTMLYGLFSSELADGVAHPQFSPLVFERTPVKPDMADATVLAIHALQSSQSFSAQ